MTDLIRMAIIGAGKIARDMHVPTMERHPRFECVCAVSPRTRMEGIPGFATIEEAVAAVPIDAVAICTPPQVRRDIAIDCIARGKHVLLEKPPADTPERGREIRDAADAAGVVAFASWHSRHTAKVREAKSWLADKTLTGGSITWREDVFKWHPGQTWLWDEGGLGVFDPGINALSILTDLVDGRFDVDAVEFHVPANAVTPVEARFTLRCDNLSIPVDLSFLERHADIWQICLESGGGDTFVIEHGGSSDPDGDILDGEYYGLYDRFAALVDAGRSEVDVRPSEIVAEAFRKASVKRVAPIEV